MDRIDPTRLRQFIEDRGLNRNVLAKRAGLAPATVCRLSKGTGRVACRRGTLRNLAGSLKVDPAALTGGPAQRGLWPTLVASDHAPESLVLHQLRETPSRLRGRAAREAIAAIMSFQVRTGIKPSVEAYEALFLLDAAELSRRPPRPGHAATA